MSRAERARIAFNNKLQLQLTLAAMKRANRQSDRRELIDAYELKLEQLENEITESNELLKTLPEQRVKIRKELSSLLDRLERFGRANYEKDESDPDNIKYYKRIPQVAKEFVMAEATSDGKVTEDNMFDAGGSGSYNYSIDYMERPDKKIEISEDVYKAAGFEEQEIKKLLRDRQADYTEIKNKEVALVDKYVKNKGSEDLKFKADILKEQLANDDIHFDMYLNYKDDFDGVVYDEEKKIYTPVKVDDYISAEPLSSGFNYEYRPFKSSLGDIEFELAQTAQSRDSRKNIFSADSFWAQTGTDFTSKYIKSGRTFMMPAKAGSQTQFDGMALQQAPPEEEMDVQVEMELMQSPGIRNPNYKSGRSLNPLANTQRDMQRQVGPLVRRKNQNMNPAGFNMKNFLQKKPK